MTKKTQKPLDTDSVDQTLDEIAGPMETESDNESTLSEEIVDCPSKCCNDEKIIMEKLQRPFKASEIEWRVGSTTQDKTSGLALAYVTNRAIMNRLDEVFGCFGWKNEFKEWKGNSQICGISVKRSYEWEDQWITKWDGADDSNTEATKGGLSDAMKRAAYQWGIGRYLYDLPQVWVPLKNGRIVSPPALPAWALPEGEKEIEVKTTYTLTGTQHLANEKVFPFHVTRINSLINEKSIAKGKDTEEGIENIKKKYNVKDFNELTVSQAEEIIKKLEAN